MRLKEYQQRALDQTREYLRVLALWRDKARENPDIRNFPMAAWEEAGFTGVYHSRRNGLGQPLPNFCMKVPTGGGKTLLAVKALDAVHELYLKRRTGLVLWVVPSNQIYRQTLGALRDKGHPYRQALDLASANRSVILEKGDRFAPSQVRENLAVLLLMLPSANRQTNDTLRLFKDAGGFQDFFPKEDDKVGHEALKKSFPNLDCFGEGKGLWTWQVKSSLGNVLRTLQPLLIVDEGHKTYSALAQQTLEGFNPCLTLELSATPPETANKLVDIPGMDLLAEQMIKLDLHVYSLSSKKDWQDSLAAGKARLDALAHEARQYRSKGGAYIRPICLVQVERTGADQRGGGTVHAEDAREYLVKRLGVDPAAVAVKSSEKDELPAVDDEQGLLSEASPIQFIITKQALQEGWDCPFAYVLVVLGNPSSKTGLTQLLGRILRQPYARKTSVPALDESYVYCNWGAKELMDGIRDGFKREGLGDLQGRVNSGGGKGETEPRIAQVRPQFMRAVSRPILPVFVNKRNQPVRYESDILRRVEWDRLDSAPLERMALNAFSAQDVEIRATLDENPVEAVRRKALSKAVVEHGQELSPALLAQQWLDVVPNPWRAFELAKKVLESLVKVHGVTKTAGNMVGIAAEGRKMLADQVESLAENVFRELLAKDELRFVLIAKDFSGEGSSFPKSVSYPTGARKLRDENDEDVQKSLFDFVPDDDFNETEREVALFLEKQERLFFWYRNRVKRDYGIQGWKRHRLYPDFIFTTTDDGKNKSLDKVYVAETKGAHLLGNDKTLYLKAMLELCTEQAKLVSLTALGKKLQYKVTQYEVLPDKEWEQRLTELFEGPE